jgi:hypothetical protein
VLMQLSRERERERERERKRERDKRKKKLSKVTSNRKETQGDSAESETSVCQGCR